MTKKISLLLVMLLCMNCIFTAASAYDSPWSHYKGPASGEPAEQPTEEPVVETPVEAPVTEPVTEIIYDEGTVADGLHSTGAEIQSEKPAAIPEPVIDVPAPVNNSEPGTLFSGSGELRTKTLTIDSISLYGEIDENTQNILNMLSGIKMSSASQNGAASRTVIDLSMQDNPLFTLDVQSGTPYYISSNFLGEETYMIYSEDEFAEKLVTAFYRLMEKTSGDTSNLPELDQVLSVIKSIRQGKIGTRPDQITANFNLTQEVDPSALMAPVMDIMTRFVPAEPTKDLSYRYTDLDPETLEYEWPAEASLPEISEAASATTAMFFGEDIITLLDCLPQFLADNPDLTDALNQVIAEAVSKTNSGTEIPEGTDFLGELINSLRESSQSLEDYYLNLKIDNDAYGSPVLITVEIGKPQDNVNTGLILTIMPVNNYPQTAVDIAADAFQNDETLPLFRMISNSQDGDSSLNFRYADPNDTALEFAQNRHEFENGDNLVAETTINYDFSGISGKISAVKTSVPNSFGGVDVFTQATYDQSMMGQPMFTVDLSAEVVSSDPLPVLTPADAVHASEMTETDFDNLAGTVFMQLMMIVMNFM